MMKKVWKPALFFVVCLAICLGINLPITLVLEQVKLPNNIKLQGVKGRVASGYIASAYVNNFPLSDINYQTDFSCLLTLKICYRLIYQNGQADISLNLLTNQANIEQLDVEYSMEQLTPLMTQLLVKPTGELSLKFNQISIKENKISDIDGLATWRNAGVVGEDLNLGNYQLAIEPEDGNYRFQLTDIKAMLDIEGSGRLKPNGEYLVDIKIQADSNLNASVKSILALAAQQKGLNQYEVHRQGQLPPHLVSQLLYSSDI